MAQADRLVKATRTSMILNFECEREKSKNTCLELREVVHILIMKMRFINSFLSVLIDTVGFFLFETLSSSRRKLTRHLFAVIDISIATYPKCW